MIEELRKDYRFKFRWLRKGYYSPLYVWEKLCFSPINLKSVNLIVWLRYNETVTHHLLV